MKRPLVLPTKKIAIWASIISHLMICGCEKNKPESMAQGVSYDNGVKRLRFYESATDETIFVLTLSNNTDTQITNIPNLTPDINSLGVFVNRTYWNGFWYDRRLIKIKKGSTYDLQKLIKSDTLFQVSEE